MTEKAGPATSPAFSFAGPDRWASAGLVGLVPLAWLLPNHYLPWATAYQEGLALALTLLAGLAVHKAGWATPLWAAGLALALATLLGQAATGLVIFAGDAWVAALHVSGFAVALATGSALSAPSSAGSARTRIEAAEALAMALAAGAIFCVGLALSQWAQNDAVTFVIPVDLPPGGRPFANFGQPNHLCTACFLGLCALGLLRETARIGRLGFWSGALFLLLGMVLSGSRTGWLQVGTLVMFLLAMRRRAQLGARPAGVLALGGAFAAMVMAWPHFSELVGLEPGRDLAAQMQGGTRLGNWASFVAALREQPLWGYGWQQVIHAQQAVALARPAMEGPLEHSHNLVLDLLLYAGLPLGGLMVLLFTAAILQQWHAARCGRSAWLMLAALGLLVHALLEYPLHYAYFLLPLGLLLGMAQGLQPTQSTLTVRPWLLRSTASVLAAVLAIVALDYLKAEHNFRQLRFEAALIGASPPSVPPDLLVLDQLEDYLWFVRTQAHPGMAPHELQRMARVARRYPHPPVLLRHALAAGLNGEPEQARQALGLVCKIHPPERCEEGIAAWTALQERFPALRGIGGPRADSPRS